MKLILKDDSHYSSENRLLNLEPPHQMNTDKTIRFQMKIRVLKGQYAKLPGELHGLQRRPEPLGPARAGRDRRCPTAAAVERPAVQT